MAERKFFTMAKKTARPDAPESPNPPRRRAPADGRRTATRRAPAPGGNGPIASAPTPAALAPDNSGVRIAADMDVAAGRTPSPEEIAEAAYRRYLERGGQHGRDFDDWLEAERSLRSR